MKCDSWMFTLLLDAARCAVGAAVGTVVCYFTVQMLESHESTTTTATSEAEMKIQEIAKRLGREIETSSYEELLADDIINPDNIEVGFESIGGLETKKNELHELAILPLQRPKLFSHGNLSAPPKGVLLYGPPGTGKTMLAKAIAKESGAVFINVKMSKLKSQWYGQSEKMGAAVFSLAHKLQPSIIFIDEVDSLLGQRQITDDETSTNMKNEFMASWDGLTTNPNARVMVLGATNRPAILDEAIHRRFSEAFEIGLPNRKERVDILRGILKGERVEESINFDHIAGLCDGYSGSDLFHLCRKAVKYPIKELLNAEKKSGDKSSSESDPDPDPEPKPRALLQKDLEKVLMTSIRTSVAAKEYGRLSESSLTYYI